MPSGPKSEQVTIKGWPHLVSVSGPKQIWSLGISTATNPMAQPIRVVQHERHKNILSAGSMQGCSREQVIQVTCTLELNASMTEN